MLYNNFSDNKRKIYLASCLYDCIEDNNIRAIKRLLSEKGANPNIIIPDRGISPFHLAIGHGSEENAIEIAKLFLAHDGNPNISSEEGLTPVHIAGAWGRLQILSILLNCGGDPSIKDEEGKTPLDYAKQEAHLDVVQFLQNYLNDVNNFDTCCEKISYDITLDKVIINSGSIVAEYGICSKENKSNQVTLDPDNILDGLPSKVVNSYVHNWCMTHAHINCSETDNIQISANNITNEYLSETESLNNKSNISRESGILTIPSSDVSQEENLIDLFNNCMIVNNSEASLMTKTTNSSAYVTCDSVNSFEKNILTLDLTEDLVATNLTENINHVTNIPCQLSQHNETNESIISITEEYKYIDKENDIVLIEKRILVQPKSDEAKSCSSANTKASSKVSTLPSILEYDTDTLRLELTARGEIPGPITKTTKRVYLKKLKKLQKENIFLNENRKIEQRVYSVELEKTLRDSNWSKDLTQLKSLENIVSNQFTNPDPKKRWREGVTKASFTYLLLDPRVTDNLPARSEKLEPDELWRTFLSAIFYVGKGKRSRPYSHLYQAVTYWKTKEDTSRVLKQNKKIEYILNIWKEQFGVICLHIFQNVIPVEAYTREAAMIHALKLQNLCNSKTGDFYGISATWPEKQKRLFGVYLLYRAMLIFVNEGERQLRPDDIGK